MNQTIIKKVTPYPIDVVLTKAGAATPTPFKAQIVKLVQHGFLMQADVQHLYQVNEVYEVTFEIPAFHVHVKVNCKVIKTYDAIESAIKGEKKKLHTAELHFINLASEMRTRISEFLVKIGQK